MSIVFGRASKADSGELTRLRIAYIEDGHSPLGSREKEDLEKRLPDYFERKLGNELMAFTAKDGDRMIAAALLLIIEMPANASLPNGLYGKVLSVYTEPAYRGKGICTRLMKDLLACGKERGLGRIDLSAAPAGYPVYKKLGFNELDGGYTEMRFTYRGETV
ncbi:MAG: hypothetical protein CW338_09160 [Clostridiales bacterium]|nr:hypothetical protein [Clostridiales bacterium]